MKKILSVILFMFALTQAKAQFVSATYGSGTGTSVSTSSNVTASAGETLFMVGSSQANSSVTPVANAVPAVSGACGLTWHGPYYMGSYIGSGYYAHVTSSFNCSPQLTWGASGTYQVGVIVLSGLVTAYTIDAPWVANSSTNTSPMTQNIVTSQSGDYLLSVVVTGAGATVASSSSFTLESSNSVATAGTLAFLDKASVSPGNQTSGTTFTGGTLSAAAIIAFRTSTPTFGELQTACQVSGSSVTSQGITFDDPAQASDLVIMQAYTGSQSDTSSTSDSMPSFVDDKSDPFLAIPVNSRGDGAGAINLLYFKSVTAGAQTFTVSSVTGQVLGGCITEVVGVTSLINSTIEGGSTASSANTGTLTLPTGNVFVYSSTADFDTGCGASYSPSSGWVTRSYLPCDSSLPIITRLHGTYDQVITGGGQISNTIFVSPNFSNSSLPILAFNAVTNNNVRVYQRQNSGGAVGISSTVAQLNFSFVPSDALVAYCVSSSGGGMTFTDSCSNTYTILEGGGSTNYEMAITYPTCSSQITVTCNTSGNASATLLEVTGSTGTPIHNSATVSGFTIADGGTVAPDYGYLMESFAGSAGGCNSPSPVSEFLTFFRGGLSSHCTAGANFETVSAGKGFFENTYSVGSGTWDIDAAIIGFEPAVPPSTPNYVLPAVWWSN